MPKLSSFCLCLFFFFFNVSTSSCVTHSLSLSLSLSLYLSLPLPISLFTGSWRVETRPELSAFGSRSRTGCNRFPEAKAHYRPVGLAITCEASTSCVPQPHTFWLCFRLVGYSSPTRRRLTRVYFSDNFSLAHFSLIYLTLTSSTSACSYHIKYYSTGIYVYMYIYIQYFIVYIYIYMAGLSSLKWYGVGARL